MKTLFVIATFVIAQASIAQIIVADTTISTYQSSKPLTVSHSSNKASLKAIIVPATFITYGIIAQGNNGLHQLDKSTKSTIITNHAGYKTTVDNYLQFAPAISVYALNAFGVKGKNNFRDRSMLYALSSLISTAMVTPLKHVTNVTRPDGSSSNSFPSGHTTTAFAAAEFLRMEYKNVSPWYGVAGYIAAAATGSLRVYNNRHWVSDVVAGAGFGILSTKLAYWIYPTIKRKLFSNKQTNAMLIPYYQAGNTGLIFVYRFTK